MLGFSIGNVFVSPEDTCWKTCSGEPVPKFPPLVPPPLPPPVFPALIVSCSVAADPVFPARSVPLQVRVIPPWLVVPITEEHCFAVSALTEQRTVVP